eukprot:CAMPEP_0171998646 /NCGR_PEP_ID=MMETSP1041-20130122/1351_1 /TAXON_ID=464988 /ORGANISM="Hemiselmis andersenii, Strain CCMP439" /LENGTH=62 /DNA_ID=CAMNT_0012652041 /DNA_START=12 /DNA_END=200 /DNA_ORIENTATION=+
MLFLIAPPRMLVGTDQDAWTPFKPVAGAPWQYPGYHDPTDNYWMPSPHPYAESEPWPVPPEM